MIELRPFTAGDVAAHNAGEDDETIRWLSGVPSTEESTSQHFATLTANADRAAGKRGFGVWLDGRLAGYIDFDPDAGDLPAVDDVNIAYAIHPWARRRGVASSAVRLVCAHLAEAQLGTRAIIRVEPTNLGSVRVAERCGFHLLDEGPSSIERHADGSAVIYASYAIEL